MMLCDWQYVADSINTAFGVMASAHVEGDNLYLEIGNTLAILDEDGQLIGGQSPSKPTVQRPMKTQTATEIAANITAQLTVHCTIMKSDKKGICHPDDLTEAIADAIEAGATAMLERCVKVVKALFNDSNHVLYSSALNDVLEKLQEGQA